MPKGNNTESEPLTRTKRNIEEQIKDIKRNERFTIDLDFLEQINSTDILENQIQQLKKEVSALKNKNVSSPNTLQQNASQPSTSNQNTPQTSNASQANQHERLLSLVNETKLTKEKEYQKDTKPISFGNPYEIMQFRPLTNDEETSHKSVSKPLEHNIDKPESVQSNATYVIKKHDLDAIINDQENFVEHQSLGNKQKYNDNLTANDKDVPQIILEPDLSNTSSDFEEFVD